MNLLFFHQEKHERFRGVSGKLFAIFSQVISTKLKIIKKCVEYLKENVLNVLVLTCTT